MKKLLCILLLLCLLVSCAAAEGMRVAALKGPTAMGMVQLMENAGEDNYQISAAADEITPLLAQGKLDVAALPANLAAVLYQRTEGEIQVLAVNTLGVLYIAEIGDSVHSVSDLAGKTIYTAGKGSTPEYALKHVLESSGLTPGKDVTIEFKAEHAECLSALLNDPEAVAMLPQPFLTTAMTKAEGMRAALDLNAEWEKVSEGSIITGVAVARREYVQENPEKIAKFLEDYAASVAFVQENVDDAAALVEKYGIVTAEVARKALPECQIVCITGDEMRERLGAYLSVLYAQNPEAVGGALPDAEFYYAAP